MTQFLMVFLLKLPGCVAVGLSTCSLVIDKSKKDIICRVIFLSRVDGIIVVLIVTTCMAFTLLYLTLAKLGFSLSCKLFTFFKPIFPRIIRKSLSCVFVVVSFLLPFACSPLFFLSSCITLICWRLSTTHVAFTIPLLF